MTGATVVWISPEGVREPPSAAAQEALDAWARARGVSLVKPQEAHAPALKVDESVADRVEEELVRARDAVSAADAKAAERALAHAEAELLAHPELPQGAWLLAEVERGWSTRWARLTPTDPDRAAAAWRRAEGLDGGRIAGVGETQASGGEPPVEATLVLEGDTNLRAWLDGERIAPGRIVHAPGRHQLVVTRDVTPSGAPRGDAPQEVTVWASWVTITQGAELRATLGPPPPCSAADLSRAKLVDAAPAGTQPYVAAPGVRCASWVAATSAEVSGIGSRVIRVASCERTRCGPLVEWRTSGAAPSPSPPHAPPQADTKGWPAWATWTLVGVGAAAAVAGVVLISTGALEPSRTEPQFVNGGIKTHAFGF